MFIAALFMRSKTWKQFKSLLMVEEIVLYSSSLSKRNKLQILLTHGTEWKNLQNIIRNEKNPDTKEFILPASLYIKL